MEKRDTYSARVDLGRRGSGTFYNGRAVAGLDCDRQVYSRIGSTVSGMADTRDDWVWGWMGVIDSGVFSAACGYRQSVYDCNHDCRACGTVPHSGFTERAKGADAICAVSGSRICDVDIDVMGGACVRSWKGSYTVEAAVIVPLLIGTMAIAMRIAIMLYEEVRDQREEEAVQMMWEVEEFYRYQVIQEVTHD